MLLLGITSIVLNIFVLGLLLYNFYIIDRNRNECMIKVDDLGNKLKRLVLAINNVNYSEYKHEAEQELQINKRIY